MEVRTGKDTTRKTQIVLLCIAIAVPVALWARFHENAVRGFADPYSEPALTAVADQAQPVLDALEKYRAENGLYPVSLNRLRPGYLASNDDLSGFRYSARQSEWIFQSDACLAREQTQGSKLREVTAELNEVTRFKSECVIGYREYQLQSPDFPSNAKSRAVERWAYYDSQPQYWAVGWCQQVGTKGGSRKLATNGVCREHNPKTDSR
jgi:hypothetical protein